MCSKRNGPGEKRENIGSFNLRRRNSGLRERGGRNKKKPYVERGKSPPKNVRNKRGRRDPSLAKKKGREPANVR